MKNLFVAIIVLVIFSCENHDDKSVMNISNSNTENIDSSVDLTEQDSSAAFFLSKEDFVYKKSIRHYTIDSIFSFQRKVSQFIPILGDTYEKVFQDSGLVPKSRNEQSYYLYNHIGTQNGYYFITVVGAENLWSSEIRLLKYHGSTLDNSYQLAASGSIHDSDGGFSGKKFSLSSNIEGDKIYRQYREFYSIDGKDSITLQKNDTIWYLR